jgi:hypothetical protein
VPEVLRVRFERNGQPRPGLPYLLEVDGVVTQGTTDPDGGLEQSISPDARAATLRLRDGDREEVYDLALGELDPVTEVRGARQRLYNLGLLPEGKGGEDSALQDALTAFQKAQGLDPTGQRDSTTLARLSEVYRS